MDRIAVLRKNLKCVRLDFAHLILGGVPAYIVAMLNLDNNSRNVLRVIYNRGVVRGRDVKRFADIKEDEDLRAAIDTLTKKKFVTIQTGSCGVESAQAAKDAYIVLLPSRKAEVEYELSQSDS